MKEPSKWYLKILPLWVEHGKVQKIEEAQKYAGIEESEILQAKVVALVIK